VDMLGRVIGYFPATQNPEGEAMPNRINRAVELLEQDQAIYYTGGHSGHVLTYPQGCEDAHVWADYINVGMEHGAFDMTGLAEYMRGLVEGGATRFGSPHADGIVEAPVNGTDAANVRSMHGSSVKSSAAAYMACCCARQNPRRRYAPLSKAAAIRTRRPVSINLCPHRASECAG